MTITKFLNMDSAPKDGREVILKVACRAGVSGRCLVGHYMPGGHCIEDHPPIDAGWYFWNGLLFDKAAEPVGWLPLPDDGDTPKLNQVSKQEMLSVLEAWEAIGHDIGVNPSKEELLDSLRNMSRLVEILSTATNPAVNQVLTERIRQIQAHGYDGDHDDEHTDGELLDACICYAIEAQVVTDDSSHVAGIVPAQWPWDPEFWKPGTPHRMLEKALALGLAELERQIRAEERAAQPAEAVQP